MKITVSRALLEQSAAEHRRIVSEWRALLLLRRATFEIPTAGRRWTTLPRAEQEIRPILRQMERRGEITSLPGLRGIYQVAVPYAETLPVTEQEVLGEVNPYAAQSDLSALSFHGLTDQFPVDLYALISSAARDDLLPVGTEASEWEGLPLPPSRTPTQLLGRTIHWRRVGAARLFGIRDYRPHGYPVRVTVPERTLLDALQQPERSGGIGNALRAWALAIDTVDLDLLIHYTDLYDIGVLRQRVGFILEQLGVLHPILDQWQQNAKRGGSSKLFGAGAYASEYDERWSLSLNAPVDALRGTIP